MIVNQENKLTKIPLILGIIETILTLMLSNIFIVPTLIFMVLIMKTCACTIEGLNFTLTNCEDISNYEAFPGYFLRDIIVSERDGCKGGSSGPSNLCSRINYVDGLTYHLYYNEYTKERSCQDYCPLGYERCVSTEFIIEQGEFEDIQIHAQIRDRYVEFSGNYRKMCPYGCLRFNGVIYETPNLNANNRFFSTLPNIADLLSDWPVNSIVTCHSDNHIALPKIEPISESIICKRVEIPDNIACKILPCSSLIGQCYKLDEGYRIIYDQLCRLDDKVDSSFYVSSCTTDCHAIGDGDCQQLLPDYHNSGDVEVDVTEEKLIKHKWAALIVIILVCVVFIFLSIAIVAIVLKFL